MELGISLQDLDILEQDVDHERMVRSLEFTVKPQQDSWQVPLGTGRRFSQDGILRSSRALCDGSVKPVKLAHADLVSLACGISISWFGMVWS